MLSPYFVSANFVKIIDIYKCLHLLAIMLFYVNRFIVAS